MNGCQYEQPRFSVGPAHTEESEACMKCVYGTGRHADHCTTNLVPFQSVATQNEVIRAMVSRCRERMNSQPITDEVIEMSRRRTPEEMKAEQERGIRVLLNGRVILPTEAITVPEVIW